MGQQSDGPPAMSPATARSTSASASSTGSRLDTERMNELKQVKSELEEALRQVKDEMKRGGAGSDTKSTARCKTGRSDVSRSTASSAMPTDWEAWGRGKKKSEGLTGRTGR